MAQYFGLRGIEEMQRKLSQSPKGTEFSLQVLGPRSEQERITAEMRQYAARSGLVFE